jgi:DNA primase
VTPPVVLNIALTNNQVLLSWPSSAGNFGLQVTTNLVSSANWSAVGNAPTTNGNTITVTIPVTKTNQFFRLENQ